MDFEMRLTTNNISVKFIDVDLLASGPPDAMFDDAANSTEQGNSVEQAWRFGSMGPDIYDFVMIGVPYNTSEINESEDIYINITKFYYEDSLSSASWEQGVNEIDELEGTDYEDYADDEWAYYINGTGALCNASDVNLTSGLCFKNETDNMLWFKIPHFSGINPAVTGTAIGGDNGDGDGPGGGGGGGAEGQTFDAGILGEGSGEQKTYTQILSSGDTIKFKIIQDGQSGDHQIKIIKIESDSITITISSTLQTITVGLGKTAKVDLNEDGIYDLSITITEIVGGKVKLIITKIIETVKPGAATGGTQSQEQENGQETKRQEGEKLKFNPLFYVMILGSILVIVMLIIKTKYKIKEKEKFKKSKKFI
jgi:hypothetical protein